MPGVGFDVNYLKAEIEAINDFRDQEARIGLKLTPNEAAMLWVMEGHARRFRDNYERRENEQRKNLEEDGA